MTRDELYEKAKLLPLTPGVYIMHSSSGKVIYVGKSKALKNRVSSYFMATAKHNAKTRKMVSSVNDFEVYHTKTEMEALILENQFIKQFLPRYNIKLKDDSDYPYIELTADDYPRLSVVYKRKNSKNHYFGPYSSASVAYEIVKATKKAFKLPTCKKVFPDEIGKGRPCLDFHLGQCFAPCIKENAAKSDFWAAYSAAEKFLKGDFNSLLKELSTNMEKASEALEFEHAAKLRDTIQSVKKLGEKQHIVAPLGTIADVVGIYYDDLGSAVSVLFIRNGAISDRENFFFSADEIINSGNITSFLYRFYLAREFIPKEIYIDF
ncbi:MAG: excinuclease ABC subunit UvrC, partial [Clostridia bacterium]